METNTTIENGQVVETKVVTTDLERFIDRKQAEVKDLQDQIEMFTTRLNSVLAELSKLIQK